MPQFIPDRQHTHATAISMEPIKFSQPECELFEKRQVKAHPDLVPDMLTIAEALVAQGADVTAGHPVEPGAAHHLSPL